MTKEDRKKESAESILSAGVYVSAVIEQKLCDSYLIVYHRAHQNSSAGIGGSIQICASSQKSLHSREFTLRD